MSDANFQPVVVLGRFAERPDPAAVPAGTVFIATDIRYSATATLVDGTPAGRSWEQSGDAQFFVTTAPLAPTAVGHFARLTAGQPTLELNTSPGTASLGIVTALVTSGTVQLAVVSTGIVDGVVTDGAPLAAGARLANDALARATAAVGPVVVAGTALRASVGATVQALIAAGAAPGVPTGPLPVGGDLSGTTANATVVGLQTRPVSAAAPNDGDVLDFNVAPGPHWEPTNTFRGTKVVAGIWSFLAGVGKWARDFVFLADPGATRGVVAEDGPNAGDAGTGMALVAGNGANASAVVPGGNGGVGQVLAGDGGAGSAAQVGGNGATAEVVAGNGGADGGAGAGAPGNARIDAGIGGTVLVGDQRAALVDIGTGSNGTQVQVAAPTVDADTALLVTVDRLGVLTLDRVTVGAPNSGGAGFRQLLVVN